uniref:Uncharacterized protein n=1 Tax=viral metagenome TaxID=1070528 RepID=A0A6H2A3Q6_9ZZZZ
MKEMPEEEFREYKRLFIKTLNELEVSNKELVNRITKLEVQLSFIKGKSVAYSSAVAIGISILIKLLF